MREVTTAAVGIMQSWTTFTQPGVSDRYQGELTELYGWF